MNVNRHSVFDFVETTTLHLCGYSDEELVSLCGATSYLKIESRQNLTSHIMIK